MHSIFDKYLKTKKNKDPRVAIFDTSATIVERTLCDEATSLNTPEPDESNDKIWATQERISPITFDSSSHLS